MARPPPPAQRRRPPARRRDRQRGVAAVELALILPIFLVLVMGTIDWGWYFFVHQRVVNAAREGARAGTVLPPPPRTTIGAAEDEAEDAALDYLERAQLSRAGVSATYEAVSGVDGIRVTIVYPFAPLTGFFNGLGLIPATARASALMRWQ
jgi:Flp pilus assembly protein TadG